MKKFLASTGGVLLGLFSGAVYFFTASAVHDALNYSVEFIAVAGAGFLLFAGLSLLLFFLTRKRHFPFALAFLIAAGAIDLIVLFVLGSIRYYP